MSPSPARPSPADPSRDRATAPAALDDAQPAHRCGVCGAPIARGLTRIAAVLAATVFVTACGGGSDGEGSADAGRTTPGEPATMALQPVLPDESRCVLSRGYSLTALQLGPAWASAAGLGPPRERSEAIERWTIEINETHLEHITTALAGGCKPRLDFTTRGTTAALGAGQAAYDARVQLKHNERALRDEIVESAGFPMPGCIGLVCQQAIDHSIEIDRPIALADVLAISSRAIAEAVAGGTSMSDQAHADWQLGSPRLRIPIP